MSALAFEPHADDLTLFASFEAQRLNADVVTVLQGHVQGLRGLPVTQEDRRIENACAMAQLGLESEQWPYSDADPDWDAVEAAMRAIDERLQPDVVLAPAMEREGHEQHSKVGACAQAVFGTRVLSYLTYQRGFDRTVGEPVVGTPEQIQRKLRALACFRSQIAEPSTQSWFLDGLTEYLA